jgi:hypothetical protein
MSPVVPFLEALCEFLNPFPDSPDALPEAFQYSRETQGESSGCPWNPQHRQPVQNRSPHLRIGEEPDVWRAPQDERLDAKPLRGGRAQSATTDVVIGHAVLWALVASPAHVVKGCQIPEDSGDIEKIRPADVGAAKVKAKDWAFHRGMLLVVGDAIEFPSGGRPW